MKIKGTYKVIKTGHIIEIYRSDKAPLRNERNDIKGKQKINDLGDGNMAMYKYSRLRSREKIRRLINSNFTDNHIFITLTYAVNMQDVKQGSEDIKKFIRKLKKSSPELKYIFVVEYQERGAIHYHGLIKNWNINIDWNKKQKVREQEREFAKVWGKGFINFKMVSGVDNMGAYLIKYMTKGIDYRLRGKDCYLRSRGLIEPELINDPEQVIKFLKDNGVVPVYTSEYDTQYWGNIKYKEYNLEREIK